MKTLTEKQKRKICDLIEKSLNAATIKTLDDKNGNDYPLVDYLTQDDYYIITGEEEISNIVEQIYFDMENWII